MEWVRLFMKKVNSHYNLPNMDSDVISTKSSHLSSQRYNKKCSPAISFQALLDTHSERKKKPLELHQPVNKQQTTNDACVVYFALYVEQKQAGKKVSYAKYVCHMKKICSYCATGSKKCQQLFLCLLHFHQFHDHP
eukprot:582183-Ditylum_brightwellii.AAC.1